MYILDIDFLQEGDILLTRSSSRESQLIRQVSKSEYSHAILYVGAKSCIESDGLGVQSMNLQRLLFEKEDDIIILRLKKNKKYSAKAIEFARLKIGTEYSTSEAKLARLEKEISANEPNRQYCTRFIAQAYYNAGIKIVNNPDYCSPQEIQDSHQVNFVNTVLRLAKEEEIKFAKSESPLDKQAEIHNEILESSRKILNVDIQNFEQLSDELIRQPEKDNEIVSVLKSSGYLKMWEKDIEKNPWYYSYNTLLEKVKNPEQRKQIGLFLSTSEKTTRSRFIQSRYLLEIAFRRTPLEYFRVLLLLYDKLIELSIKRENTGLQALK